MIGILLASHGNLAEGVLQAGQMIYGEQENIAACSLLPSEGPEDIKRKMETAIESFDNQDEVLILADLWGGTPFNQASSLLDGKEDKWAIVAGLNLPMLIEALGSRMGDESAQEIASHILDEARKNVRIYPESLEKVKDIPDTQKTHQTSSIPEGTVIGDGKIKYVLTRIDTRLLHGQVATSWTKTTRPDRIIVVSDAVSKDELRKNMIMQAAPSGVKAHVVPVSKMVEIDKDPRFGNTKAMILFEKPSDVLEAIELGMDIKEVNLGSVAHSLGKVVITNAIALGKDDYEAIEKLSNAGVKFDVRKVPSDKAENFDNIMRKAKKELYKGE